MSQNIDLDINNYTIRELINFFKLEQQYTVDDLDNKEGELINNILNVYSNSDINYKKELIQFIKNGKQILYGTAKQPPKNNNSNNKNKNSENDKNDTVENHKINSSTPSTILESLDSNILNKSFFQSNLGKSYNNIGKIINPLSNHPSLQEQSIPSTSVNSYNIHKTTANYVFNTRFRDNYFGTVSSNCSFTMPATIKNVIAISVSAIQIPNVANTFSQINETNQIYIYEDTTGLNAIVEMPTGNYNISNFVLELEKAINIQVIGSYPNRFTVTINDQTNTINIINSTYTFRINVIKKISDPANIFQCSFDSYELNKNIDTVDDKKKIKPSDFFTTMGYLMGFRQIEYLGKSSYTTESPFDDSQYDYVYFELDDYTDYHNQTTYGILPTYILSKNIIAVLPITTPKFISSFDNNADFIYKAREYKGPIDLKKISIKMIDEQGGLADLRFIDFSFVLEVKTIYDNMIPFNTVDVIVNK
jgi:hypothetical protein